MRTLDQAIQDCDFFVFDVDGLFYPITRDIEDAFAEAVAAAALKLVKPWRKLTHEKAVRMAWKSWEDHGFSTKIFADTYEEVSEEEIQDLYLKNCEPIIGVITADEKIPAEFRKFEDFCKTAKKSYAVLTHGTSRWARKIFAHLGLSRFFSCDQICGLEKIKDKKSESPEPFKKILKSKGYDAKRSMMLDDSKKNLRQAKAAGMITVLVTHGKGSDDKIPDYVDYAVRDLHEFFGALPAAEAMPLPAAQSDRRAAAVLQECGLSVPRL